MKLGATFRVRRRTHSRAAESPRTHARRSTLGHAISAILLSILALTALYLSKRPEVAQEIRLDLVNMGHSVQGMIRARGRSAASNTMRMPTSSMCEPQLHTEYLVGELIRPASSEPPSGSIDTSEGASEAAAGTARMMRDSATLCCDTCAVEVECDLWSWCGWEHGCSHYGRTEVVAPYRECVLLRASLEDILSEEPKVDPSIGWTSGSILDKDELAKAKEQKEQDRIRVEALRNDTALPLVYMDITIRGEPAGRMEFALYAHAAPRAAENFRAFCTVRKYTVKTSLTPFTSPLAFHVLHLLTGMSLTCWLVY